MEAEELFQSGEMGLYPLLPLMRAGLDWVEEARRALYESQLARDMKGDLIALLGMFLGLTDKEKAANLIWKRTELMNILAESPIYKQIQEEGRQEGWQKGRQEGWQKGLIEAVKLGLELRFGGEGVALFAQVDQCADLSILAEAQEAIRKGRQLEEIGRLFG